MIPDLLSWRFWHAFPVVFALLVIGMGGGILVGRLVWA
jgi:hypothetical protein